MRHTNGAHMEWCRPRGILLALGAVALFLATAVAGSGCGPPEIVTYQVHADQEPPEPYDEYVPEPPGVDHIWLPGSWYWSGTRYVWLEGRYARPPVSGHVWVRSGWIFRDGRYRYVRGYWAPPHYRAPHRYYRPAPRVHRAPHYRTAPRQPRPARPPHSPRPPRPRR